MSLNRRMFLTGAAGATAAAIGLRGTASAAERPDGVVVTPADALERLQRGNTRYANGNVQRKTYAPPGQSPEAGQWPFAAILSCSDSRVVPEDLFDVAGKNLFIVRNAGNLVDDVTMGSLEYAAVHTGISLIMVLGHTNCGAVDATQGSLATGQMPGPFVNSIVEAITPALTPLPAGYTLNDAIAANARYQSEQIQNLSPTLAAKTAAGTIGIVKGVYGLSNRRVTFLP